MLVPRFLMVVQMTVHCTISMLRFLLTLGFSIATTLICSNPIPDSNTIS